MARLDAFDRELRLATADMAPDVIARELAAFARAELAKAIAGGAPASYERYVNGREGAPEESVVAPGPIVYVFANWSLVIEAALEELRKRSPKRSGRYAGSFLVVAGGRTVVTDFNRIRPDTEIIILNPQPYTRKIEVGAMPKMSVPPFHFDAARSALSRRFGRAFRIVTKFVRVPGRIHPLTPYLIKRGRNAGKELTYPALVINAV